MAFNIINSFLTLIMEIQLFMHYINLVKWKKSNGSYPQGTSFSNAKYFKEYIFLSIILLIQPWPFMNSIELNEFFVYSEIERKTKLNYYTLLFFFPIRIYFIITSIVSKSYYKSERVQRICKLYGTENRTFLAFRFLINKIHLQLCLFYCLQTV